MAQRAKDLSLSLQGLGLSLWRRPDPGLGPSTCCRCGKNTHTHKTKTGNGMEMKRLRGPTDKVRHRSTRSSRKSRRKGTAGFIKTHKTPQARNEGLQPQGATTPRWGRKWAPGVHTRAPSGSRAEVSRSVSLQALLSLCFLC